MTALPPAGAPAAYLLDLPGLVWRFLHGGAPRRAGIRAAREVGRILRERRPHWFAAAHDHPGPTFRHALCAYKANREEKPGEESRVPRVTALEQIRVARELLEDVYGVRSVAAAGFEGDDVVAALVDRVLRLDPEASIVIIGSDKDYFQLLGERCLLWDGKGRLIGPDEVRARIGVGPERAVDYFALVGDAADNVKGVRGIGPVAARELLMGGALGLDEAIAFATSAAGRTAFMRHRAASRGPGSIQTRLAAGVREAHLARRLVRLRRDTPLPEGLDLSAEEAVRAAAEVPG